jgi:phospholipid/cholesterol/gamma-HCH transport system substrate-binding protein
MTTSRRLRAGLAAALVVLLVGGIAVAARASSTAPRVNAVGYFANANGVFVGDEVRILGVPVGKIDRIDTSPTGVKISFWYDGQYSVPAGADAVIIAPSLVTARAIQLTPAYRSGPVMSDGAVISQDRTAVPVEWDDLREQLEKLTHYLQPTEPGGVSTMGALVNTAAENLRGQGINIHDTIVKLAQAFSALGDHSADIYSTVKNLAIFVSALQSSGDLLGQLNSNLADVTGLLSNGPNEVGQAVSDIDKAVSDVEGFVADNRDAIGTTADKLASVSSTLVESIDDIKQLLHEGPTDIQNIDNMYRPAAGGLAGDPVIANFANPVSFLCSAIQAASRLNAEQSAKLCVQYLAPIVKNRQYNFLPFGIDVGPGATARPNELTYSEDWLRPDYRPAAPTPAVPDASPPSGLRAESASTPPVDPSSPAPQQVSTDPAAGLPGLMVPGGGS